MILEYVLIVAFLQVETLVTPCMHLTISSCSRYISTKCINEV
jgi:hypothetical protein